MTYKIYTQRGDSGETDLFGAGRVKKNDIRVESYGYIDEANAMLGVVRANLEKQSNNIHINNIDQTLKRIQNELFTLGSELASAGQMSDKIPRLSNADILRLEQEIDHQEAILPPLKNFILPGGHIAAALLHSTRTIIRKAERCLVSLHLQTPIRSEILKYSNRLSDHLFVYARSINQIFQVKEELWKGRSE